MSILTNFTSKNSQVTSQCEVHTHPHRQSTQHPFAIRQKETAPSSETHGKLSRESEVSRSGGGASGRHVDVSQRQSSAAAAGGPTSKCISHEEGRDDDHAMPARRRRVGVEPSFYPRHQQSAYEDDDDDESPLLKSSSSTSIVPTMSSRDRTQEFGNAIRSLQNTSVSRAAVMRSPRQARHLQTYSNFMMIAKNIGKNIASTYAKLEKLALLAKKKSIFDDRQMEIEELTTIIKTDLSSLNQQIAKLQELGRRQRESFSSSKGHHIASHSSSVVVALQSKLANMSNHFKSVLEVRSEKMREEQSRREQFSHGHVSTTLPPTVAGKQGSLLLQEQDLGASVSIDLEPAMGSQRMQMAVYDDTDNYVQSRAETMQNIESTIIELGGIFQQLAHMVKEQEEMVERIDSNIEDTEINVGAAHAEILKYFQSVTNNRWLMIKIFAVLIFFFIFFVVFLA